MSNLREQGYRQQIHPSGEAITRRKNLSSYWKSSVGLQPREKTYDPFPPQVETQNPKFGSIDCMIGRIGSGI